MIRFEEPAVHARGDLRPGLHAQIIAKEDDVDVRAYRSQVLLEVRQVHLCNFFQEGLRPVRVTSQEQEEIIVAEQELAHFEQVAPEEADDRSIGSLS
jgi:hypothetical protein